MTATVRNSKRVHVHDTAHRNMSGMALLAGGAFTKTDLVIGESTKLNERIERSLAISPFPGLVAIDAPT